MALASSRDLGTQIRPSLRRDSDIRGELGLVVATHRDAGRVNLRVARVCHVGAALVGAEGGHDIAAHGIGGEVKDVSVSAGGEDDGIGGVRGDFTRDEVTNDDSFGVSVDEPRGRASRCGCAF